MKTKASSRAVLLAVALPRGAISAATKVRPSQTTRRGTSHEPPIPNDKTPFRPRRRRQIASVGESRRALPDRRSSRQQSPPSRRQQQRRRRRGQASSPSWYPDWTGGTNVCLLDADPHPVPSYMAKQNLAKDSMQQCCDSYFWWDLIYCLENGEDPAVEDAMLLLGGDGAIDASDGEGIATVAGEKEDPGDDADDDDAPEGSMEWYADYGGFKCVQDCPLALDPSPAPGRWCGGTVSSSSSAVADDGGDASFAALGTAAMGVYADLYPTAAACCESKFPYLALGLCMASSEHDGPGVVDYAGSGEYYVDYANGRCVQDCDASTSSAVGGICGGVVLGSYTALYANATDCCSSQLSYMDLFLCTSRSQREGTEEGTFRLYPHQSTGTCVIDHDPSNAIICSIGYSCSLLHSNAWVSKLYPVSPAGVEQCCSEGLSYVNPSYCRAKTMGIVSRKWFVDYTQGQCHQDCDMGTGPSCAINTDPSVTYYDTADECCSSKLGYLNQPKCYAESTGAVYEGTNQYYVDYKNSRCAQDCPVGVPGAEDGDSANCGGVIEDASTTIYADAASCCAAKLGYMNSVLCEDRSDGMSNGTGLYYPRDDGICVKDTPTTPCPAGETCQRVDGWLSALYNSTAECCSSANVSPEYCQALSTGIGPDKWFHPSDADRCAKHCATAGGVECDMPAVPPAVYYSNASECCLSELGYLNAETCAELSKNGGMLAGLRGTDEYYVDWVRQKCMKNCPLGSGGDPNCGGIVGGNWVELHPNITTCCEKLHYIDDNECLSIPSD